MYAQMERQQSKPKESEKKTQQKCHAKHLLNNFCIGKKKLLAARHDTNGENEVANAKNACKEKKICKHAGNRERIRQRCRK